MTLAEAKKVAKAPRKIETAEEATWPGFIAGMDIVPLK